MTNLMDQEQCASLVELQDRHEALVESASDDTDSVSPEAIKHFIELCVAMGHILDAPADRSVAQSLISYWVNRQARQARRAARLAQETATDVSVQDSHSDSVFDLVDSTIGGESSSAKPGRAGSNSQLLGEFHQEAFDQCVVSPTEQWVQSLPEDEQELVGHIVLRLMTLKSDGSYEAVPGTQLVLEGLPDLDRARTFLEKLVRLGVVRRQRRSLDLEEYSLQSLERLKKWESLSKWMRVRKEFRDSAKETLAQLQSADKCKTRPLVTFGRFIRWQMIRLGDCVGKLCVKVLGDRAFAKRKLPIISDLEMQQAEYYHDKNTEELKVLYLKRQMDRLNAEISQERFVGISVALCLVLGMLTFAIVEWRGAKKQKEVAESALGLADRTAKSCSLLIAQANAALQMNTMVQDPSGAWLRGIHSFSTISANSTVLPEQLDAKWRESNLWSLGSAGEQTPVLLDVLSRVPKPKSTPVANKGELAPTEATVVSENGEVCMMVDATSTRMNIRFSSIQNDGTWKSVDTIVNQSLSFEGKLVEHSLNGFLSSDGKQTAIVYTASVAPADKTNEQTGRKVHTYLYAGPVQREGRPAPKSLGDLGEVKFIAEIGSLGTASFDAEGKYFALACNAKVGNAPAELTIWSTSSWEKLSTKALPSNGRVSVLAFSRNAILNVGRNVVAPPESMQIAAAVSHNTDGFTVLQLGFQGNASEWQTLLSTDSYNPDSSIVLRYSPQANYVLFCSHDGKHYLMGSSRKDPESASLRLARTSFGNDQCRACAFNSDGSLLALGMRDGPVTLWNVESLIKSIEQRRLNDPDSQIPIPGHPQHREEVFGVHFSPDSKYLITCSRDKLVQIYDIYARQLASPPIIHNGTVNSAIVSENGRFLTTLIRDVVYSWELPTTRFQKETWAIPSGRSIAAISHSSKDWLAVGGKRSERSITRGWIRVCPSLRLEDRPLDEIDLPHAVQHLAIHDEGKWLCSVDERGNANLFYDSKSVWSQDNSEMNARFVVFDGNSVEPRLLICGENRQAGRRSVVRVLQPKLTTGQAEMIADETYEFPNNNENSMVTVAMFDPWHVGCVVGTEAGSLYYCKPGNQITKLTVNDAAPHKERVTQIAFHASSKLVVSGSEDDRVSCWHVADTGWESKGFQTEKANGANITSLAVSPSGQKLAAASADGRTVIWRRRGDSAEFDLFYTLYTGDAGQNTTDAMVQVDFVEQVADERYLFCRRSDRTVRVFDTLQISDPLKSDELLVDAREVASFPIPHQVNSARLKVDSQGQWVIQAVGYENLKSVEVARAPARPTELNQGNAQVAFSTRVVRPFPESILTENDGLGIKSLASLVSGRQMKGQLRPLAPLHSQDVHEMWNSAKEVRKLWPNADSLSGDEWHMREAENSLDNQLKSPLAPKWHFQKISNPTPFVHLQFATALPADESERALDQLKMAEPALGGTLDFLTLRASLQSKQFESNKAKSMIDGAIADYQKILEKSPGDVITRVRLANAYGQVRREDLQLVELNQAIDDTRDNPIPQLVKMRGDLHFDYTKEIELALQDMSWAADLFMGAQQYDEAYGELMGAIRLIKRNDLEVERRAEFAMLYSKLGDVQFLRNSAGNFGASTLEAYYQACQIDPDNSVHLQRLFSSFLRSKSEARGSLTWAHIDRLFVRAIEDDRQNAEFYRQRISALLPKDAEAQEVSKRFELILQTFQAMESATEMTAQDYMDLAAVYVHLNELAKAEEVLKRASEKHPKYSVLGVRLGLVLALQGKQDELKQLVETMSKKELLDIDKNNVAWTATFTNWLPADFTVYVELVESATKDSGNDKDAYLLNTLGSVYLRSGRYLEAIEKLKEATERRNELPEYMVSRNDKLYGNAIDLLFSSIAQRDLNNHAEADELLDLAEQRFKLYRSNEAYGAFYDLEWNEREFELFLNLARQLQQL